MSYIWYGLAVSLAHPSEEEGGNFLVQIISTFPSPRVGGGGVGTLWVSLPPES